MTWAAGDLDLGFGTSPGYSLVNVDTVNLQNDQGRSIIIDHAGRIVIGGLETHLVGGNPERDMVLVRLLADGTPDASFGPGGIRSVAFNLGGFEDVAVSVVETADHKYVACGLAENDNLAGGTGAFAVARLLENGVLDTTFDFDGRTTYYVPLASANSVNTGGACDVMPDGRIVQVGTAIDSMTTFGALTVTRLLANGAPDTSFSGDGKMLVDIAAVDAPIAYGFAVKLRPDGRILVTGATNTAATGANFDMYVASILPNGDMDGSFGTGGIRLIAFDQGGNTDLGLALALVDNGGVLVGGSAARTGGYYDFAAARLLPNGALDPSFGTGGRVLVAYDGGGDLFDQARGIGTDGAGNVYLAGEVRVDVDNSDAAVLRLQPDGTPDASWASGGWRRFGLDVSPTFDTEAAYGLVLDDSQRPIVAGLAYIGPTNNNDILAFRLTSDRVFADGFEGSP